VGGGGAGEGLGGGGVGGGGAGEGLGGGGEGGGGEATEQISPETLFRKSHPSERSQTPSSQPLSPVGNGHAKLLPVRSQPWFPLWPEIRDDEANDAGTVPDSLLFGR